MDDIWDKTLVSKCRRRWSVVSDEDGVLVVVDVEVEEEDGPFAANSGGNFHDVDADVGLLELPLACITINCRECTDTSFLWLFHILLFPQTSLFIPKPDDSFLPCCRCRPPPTPLLLD